MKKIFKKALLFIVITVISIVIINLVIVKKSEKSIYKTIDEVPEKQTVIVLGAFVRGDNLSMVLEDRMNSGMMIYNDKKVSKILLSGDHSQENYDEVNAMRKYILETDNNILVEDIFMDHAGFDTYDSLYRAKEIFELESAIIVTQQFHINRAVYIANELGIDAVGYSVNEEKYKKVLRYKWQLREYLSRVKAFVDVKIKSTPKYLGEKIPITGDSRISWDEED